MADPAPVDALPVDGVLDELCGSVDAHSLVVLEAPPGAGKTTRVPPALAARRTDDARVVVLEPRRVAARAAAQRMADERGEALGRTIGLRTSDDTRVSEHTRVEVVTEGVLTRMLLADPALDGIGVVVFDEFHERNLHADIALAFTRETTAVLRPDLRTLVMSATLDPRIPDRLGTDAVIRTEGRAFPVEISHRVPAPGRRATDEVPDAVVDALAAHPGDVLVFLAGVGDIERARRGLDGRVDRAAVAVVALHGTLSPAEQDRALRRDPKGRRKVVLSTPIAETSVTIDGVGIVIDTGTRRRPVIDHGRGMSALRTVTASRAAADQRAGRAGRQGPGVCIRLWPANDHPHRPAAEPAEIETADLTALALDLASWGATDATELPWIDPPPPAALTAGRETLRDLGALDADDRLTPHGRAMASLGTEPRLAHLLRRSVDADLGATGCAVAALLSERDLIGGRDRPTDLRLRLDRLDGLDRGAPAQRRYQRWRRRLDVDGVPDPEQCGVVVSFGFPDRIAQRRRAEGSVLLANGAGASIRPDDGLAAEEFSAVAELSGDAADAQVRLAAPLDLDALTAHHHERITRTVRGGWDRRARDVVFAEETRLGALVLVSRIIDDPDPDEVIAALLEGLRREGPAILTWTQGAELLRARIAFLHHHDGDGWPDVSDDALVDEADEWLAPLLGSARRRRDLEAVDVRAALAARLDWRQTRDLDRLAPTHVTVPSGSRIPVDYADPDAPVLAVRLQELFGLDRTPTVGPDVALVVHLLSPAHRPVQVTRDLASFWREGYAEVRRELRGRYPKHHWPDDPSTAEPTGRTRPRS